ncbi:MAG TPA: ankyrin repeat domain-containing protein [Burkholderiaceae bacterium]
MTSRLRASALVLAAAVSACSAFAVTFDSVDFFRAVNVDNADAVSRMLAAGLDPNQLDPRGQPALIVALQTESLKVAKVLWNAKGIDIDVRNHAGETPLMMAARYGNEEAVDALLAAGADRTAKNDLGMDASAFAGSAGREKLAARLKPGGAK